MRKHRLISTLGVLVVLALTTMSTVENRFMRLGSDTVSAQKAIDDVSLSQADGLSNVIANETTAQTDSDLFLDAEEVERRAAAEQNGDTAISPSRVPVSFKHVALPLNGGVDHAVAGVATRNSGQGVIRLRGIPPGSTLLSAILVWGDIDPVPGGNVVFGPDCGLGQTFTTQPFGATQQPCWNGQGQFFAYMVNVTGLIQPGINGDYRVRGLRSALTDNRCPWGDGNCPASSNATPLSEGASLIVFYSNPCIPKGAQVYVSLGPRMFFGPHSVVHNTVPAINGNLPNLKHSRIGADGQVGVANCGLRAMPAITDERTWIENPITLGSIQIKGDAGGLNRDSDWNGYDGEPLNKLWDSHTDVFGSGAFLAQGGGLNYRVRYLSQGDCIVWVVHILGVR